MRSQASWGLPCLNRCTWGDGTPSSGLPGQRGVYDDPVAWSNWEQIELSAYNDSPSAVRSNDQLSANGAHVSMQTWNFGVICSQASELFVKGVLAEHLHAFYAQCI